MESMKTYRARVEKGRLVIDEPTGLPEGAEVEVLLVDAERKALYDELDAAWDESEHEETRPVEELLGDLKK